MPMDPEGISDLYTMRRSGRVNSRGVLVAVGKLLRKVSVVTTGTFFTNLSAGMFFFITSVTTNASNAKGIVLNTKLFMVQLAVGYIIVVQQFFLFARTGLNERRGNKD